MEISAFDCDVICDEPVRNYNMLLLGNPHGGYLKTTA